jgi:hypothetical protein
MTSALVAQIKFHYVGVDIDFGRSFAGQSDKLPWVQGPDDHLAGFLHSPKRGRG